MYSDYSKLKIYVQNQFKKPVTTKSTQTFKVERIKNMVLRRVIKIEDSKKATGINTQ